MKPKIVCAYAEPACGPGWANSPLWYIVRKDDGSLSLECLQPEQQNEGLRKMYGLAAKMHDLLMHELEQATSKPRKRQRD